jgi:hypothetical protein
MGVPKFPKLGLPQLWGPIILCANLRLKWGLKKRYSPCLDLFNSVLQAPCTRRNRVDSWLLVVENQTANLTLGLSFGHNLCFRCPNGLCNPILDIYVSIDFQWYKELFNTMGFYPCKRPLKIQESTGTPTPKMGVPKKECEGMNPNTLLHSREHEIWLSGFPLGRQPRKPLPWS